MPTVKGTWPGRVIIKSGWGRAQARPWNDGFDRASLRLERGTAAFLKDCGQWLLENASPDVMSVPLTSGQARPWWSAGFVQRRELSIFERDLGRTVPAPEYEPHEVPLHRASEVLAVDALAFDTEWRMSRLGLEDALNATSGRSLLGLASDGRLVAYAVAGASNSMAYLQRIAVAPEEGGRGLGRSLIRAAMRWARGKGAYTMFLNTDNAAASALYRSEGFDEIPERLLLMGLSEGRRT